MTKLQMIELCCPFCGNHFASEKYEAAANMAEWSEANLPDAADLWLRAAWCCVDEGDVEAEQFHRRLAA